MSNQQYENEFFKIVHRFKEADDMARDRLANIDIQSFRAVNADMDAVIPGLHGVNLGRALLLKAQSIYWIHVGELLNKPEKQLLMEVTQPSPPDLLMKEGLSCAIRGCRLLEELGNTDELPWANDVVSKLRGIVESS